MATKSVLKDVCISDKKLVHAFVTALTEVENAKYTLNGLTHGCKTVEKDAVKNFFSQRKPPAALGNTGAVLCQISSFEKSIDKSS